MMSIFLGKIHVVQPSAHILKKTSDVFATRKTNNVATLSRFLQSYFTVNRKLHSFSWSLTQPLVATSLIKSSQKPFMNTAGKKNNTTSIIRKYNVNHIDEEERKIQELEKKHKLTQEEVEYSFEQQALEKVEFEDGMSSDGIMFISDKSSGYDVDMKKVEALFDEGKIDECIFELKKLIKKELKREECKQKNENLSMLFNNLGVAHENKNEFAEAISSLLQSLQYKQDDAATYSNIGIIFNRTNKIQSAIEMFKKAIEFDPNLVVPKYRLAMIYSKIDDKIDEAERLLSECVTKDPGFTNAYAELIMIKSDKSDDKEVERAIELCDQLIENSDPNDHLGYDLKAYCYTKWSKPEEALQIYEQMFQNPEFNISPDSYLNAAVLYETTGSSDKAFDLCDKALKMDPQNMNAAYMLSRILETMGRYEESRTILEEVIPHDPENPLLYGMLATVMVKMGETKAARRLLERTEAKYPDLKENFDLLREFIDRFEGENAGSKV